MSRLMFGVVLGTRFSIPEQKTLLFRFPSMLVRFFR